MQILEMFMEIKTVIIILFIYIYFFKGIHAEERPQHFTTVIKHYYFSHNLFHQFAEGINNGKAITLIRAQRL